LTSNGAAETTLESLRTKVSDQEPYFMKLEGHDKDGNFTADYYYSPGLSVLKREDGDGSAVYVYDEEKRAEKVQVTRRGVAYMYRLDNPRLPSGFPESLLELCFENGEGAVDGENSFRFEADINGDNLVLTVTSLVFDPTPDDPGVASIGRYFK